MTSKSPTSSVVYVTVAIYFSFLKYSDLFTALAYTYIRTGTIVKFPLV